MHSSGDYAFLRPRGFEMRAANVEANDGVHQSSQSGYTFTSRVVSKPMIDIIPVIDLKGGKVVRARQGLRRSYAPLETPLAPTSAPIDVAAGLLSLHPFQAIYIADLDRIERSGSHARDISALIAAFPSVTFWVDPGVRDAAEAYEFLARHRSVHLVLGSESLAGHAMLEELAGQNRIILSLDYRGSRFIGPGRLNELPQLWAERVIVMSLDRVGSHAGPAIERLAAMKDRAPHARIYAAGGLRGASDLALLENAGISGVLVASALHEGELTPADLGAAAGWPAQIARSKGARTGPL